MLTVAIVDDNRLMREGLAAMLAQLPDVQVVASPSLDARLLEETKPEVLLLDAGLCDAERLREVIGGVKVVVMDLVPVPEEIAPLVAAGVTGFISKDATFDDLVGTIRAVLEGQKVIPSTAAGRLFSEIARATARRGREALENVRMTPRELGVIALIAEGLSNKEIAHRLGIAPETVKTHVRNVMEKLALHTRLEIAAYSHRA